MSKEAFALIDDGTGRAIVFADDGSTSLLTKCGVIKPLGKLKASEIPTPDELWAFRVASDLELSTLLKQVLSTSMDT